MSNDTWLYVDFFDSSISRIIPLNSMSAPVDIILLDVKVPIPVKLDNGCTITLKNPNYDVETMSLYRNNLRGFLTDFVGLQILDDLPIHVVKDWVSNNQANLSDIQRALLSHANVGIKIYHLSKFDEVGYYIRIPSSIDVSACISSLPVHNNHKDHIEQLFDR